MALKDGFRIKETSTTTGTGTVTVAGAPANYNTILSEVGEGNSFLYQLFDADGAGWEVGIGVVTGATFTRAAVIRSSNADAALVLSAGTHTVVNAPVPGFPTGDLDFNESQVIDAVITAFSEKLNVITSAAGVLTINLALGNTFSCVMTEAITSIVISNPKASGVSQSFTLKLEQGGAGSFATTFPASVNYNGGSAPTLVTAVGEYDRLGFVSEDGGTAWDLLHAGGAFA